MPDQGPFLRTDVRRELTCDWVGLDVVAQVGAPGRGFCVIDNILDHNAPLAAYDIEVLLGKARQCRELHLRDALHKTFSAKSH